MRTYSGHSTARACNELYRTNLAKGQTGLSIAFDLPTQTGYDPDDPLARGEVGKVGVPVAHLGHMRELLDGIPAGRDEHLDDDQRHRGVAARPLRGQRRAPGRGVDGRCGAPPRTTSSRSTCPAAPTSSRRCRRRRLIVDMVAFCAEWIPQVEPDERLLLPPAGGGGDAGAGDRLRPGHRHRRARRRAGVRPGAPRTGSRRCSRSISFFVNAGIRFVEETCKMRAFTAAVGPHRPRALRRHRPEGPPLPLRRAGQLARPHRGAAREQRAAHRARDARRHPVEATPGPGRSSCRRGTRRSACPARGTSSGRCACSRCWPSRPTCSSTTTSSTGRTSSRPGPPSWSTPATAELDEVLELGGAFEAIDELKGRLVRSHAERMRRIESGELTVVGVNRFTETEPSPLGGGEERILKVDPARGGRDDRRRARRGGPSATPTP